MLLSKWLSVIHTYSHTLMAVAAMQAADWHIRSSLGFSILPKDTWTCRPGELNQQDNNKAMVVPLSHSRYCIKNVSNWSQQTFVGCINIWDVCCPAKGTSQILVFFFNWLQGSAWPDNIFDCCNVYIEFFWLINYSKVQIINPLVLIFRLLSL